MVVQDEQSHGVDIQRFFSLRKNIELETILGKEPRRSEHDSAKKCYLYRITRLLSLK